MAVLRNPANCNFNVTKDEIDELCKNIWFEFDKMMGETTTLPESIVNEITCRVLEDIQSDEPGTEWNDGTIRRNIRWFFEELTEYLG